VQGLTDLPTEAAAVARAAQDVGLRVGFAGAGGEAQRGGERECRDDAHIQIQACSLRRARAAGLVHNV
jgi:hypothetical protein